MRKDISGAINEGEIGSGVSGTSRDPLWFVFEGRALEVTRSKAIWRNWFLLNIVLLFSVALFIFFELGCASQNRRPPPATATVKDGDKNEKEKEKKHFNPFEAEALVPGQLSTDNQQTILGGSPTSSPTLPTNPGFTDFNPAGPSEGRKGLLPKTRGFTDFTVRQPTQMPGVIQNNNPLGRGLRNTH